MPRAEVGVFLSILLSTAWTPAATAHPLATVTTTVDGAASMTVQPGQPVAIAVRISHNAFHFAGIAGGTKVTDNAGLASNFSTTIPALPTVNFGAFVGGSRVGAEIVAMPPGFIGAVTPPFMFNPMPVWTYSLRLDDPGVYTINWVPTAQMPNVRLYQAISSFTSVEAQTTYTGATITVLPAPASLTLLALSPITTRRRRRVAIRGL